MLSPYCIYQWKTWCLEWDRRLPAALNGVVSENLFLFCAPRRNMRLRIVKNSSALV